MNERMLSSRTENLLKHGLPAALALGGVAIFGISHAANTLAKETPDCSPSIEQVTVQTGDTIWGIAEAYVPDVDPRETVHTIVQNNPAAIDHNGDIHPGHTLSVEVCLPDHKSE